MVYAAQKRALRAIANIMRGSLIANLEIWMHDVGRKPLFIDVDALRVERIPMRVEPFAERRHDTDTGDSEVRSPFTTSYSAKFA